MKYIPKGVTRAVGRSMLKLNASSPTILVVAGVVGLGATAVLAASATRKIDPVIEDHQKGRIQLHETVFMSKRSEQRALLNLYTDTTMQLARVYGPAIAVGTLSTASVLYGHKILRGRHVASLAAYTGLMDQFQAYRSRVAKTLGDDVERGIYNGAHGEWIEDPDHKGEHKLAPVFDDKLLEASYLRPFFDESNIQWKRDPVSNYLWLKGVQQHFNNVLQIRGHVFLNEVLDGLHLPRCKEGQLAGWIFDKHEGDGHIDFGFMTGIDPGSAAFRNHEFPSVRLNFNIDGNIYSLI